MRPQPPSTIDDLWALLRSAGLLEDEQLRRLTATWDEGPIPPRLEQLVQAGVLTAYQVDEILKGRLRRLRLGPYRILDRIGAGGMARVYKAEHVLMKRLVALKVLGRVRRRRQPPSPGSAARRTMHRGELETAGRLSHPHIVAAYDAARIGGRLVLVMEYVNGIDLERLVNEAGPLPVALACAVVRQTALGLGYLHQHGLVHRDVKPANLLLVRGESGTAEALLPDGPPLVKLVDLGVACRAGEASAEPDGLCGTMNYMAPERGLAGQPADIRADLYSLGCTFYHLLTSRVPFPGGSWTGKLLRHRLEEPEPVQALRPEVPDDVAGVVARLMARDPAGRYPDPGSVVEAIDCLHLLAFPLSVPSSHPRIQPAEPPSPPPRRLLGLGPWLMLATILTGGAVGGVARLGLSPVGMESRSPKYDPATPARKPDKNQLVGGVVVSGMDRSFPDLAAAVAAAGDGAVLTLRGPGPYPTAPLNCQGKSLTLRAGPGVRPVIERSHAPEAIWDALIASDRPLTLEGLELRGGAGDIPAAMVAVEGATLRLIDCGLQGGAGPLLALRRGRSLHVEKCRLAARRQALAVEIEPGRPCRVSVRQSHLDVRDLAGTALLLWSAELGAQTAVTVELTGSTLHGGRMVACRSLAGPIDLTAVGCRMGFHEALLSFDGYRDRDAWRRTLRWAGRDNHYRRAGTWLRLEGTAGPAWSESEWERLWTPQRKTAFSSKSFREDD